MSDILMTVLAIGALIALSYPAARWIVIGGALAVVVLARTFR